MWSAMTRKLRVSHVLRVRRLRRGLDQLHEQVDVVVRVHALHDGGHALEAHAGVHRWLGERGHRAVGRALELHEDEIPDLDVAVAVLVPRAGRPARDPRAMVVEDLGTRAAGAGVAHRPEVRLFVHAREALRVDLDLLEPKIGRLVIVPEDGDPKFLGRDLQRAGDEVPGERDGLGLEVVAEAEVAEHLEESVVPRRVADVLEVVVLAAGPHAALAADRTPVAALVLAEENVLELDHAGVREQERRVVARHERRARHDLVAARAEELQERRPELVGTHVFSLTAISPRRRCRPLRGPGPR